MSKSKKNKIFFLLLVVVVAVVVFALITSRGEKEVQYETQTAERSTLVQEINATGRVRAEEEVDLSFEVSKRVKNVNVRVGDTVKRGQILAVLESGEVNAQLAQARARLAKDEARLGELEIGTRPEELRVQEVKVRNAQSALFDAKNSLINTLHDSYTKADDAVRNKVDQLFYNPRTSNPQFVFTTSSALENSAEWDRFLIEKILTDWDASFRSLQNTLSGSELDAVVIATEVNLVQTKNFLALVGLIVNDLDPNSGTPQATIDAWRFDVSTGRTNVNTAINNLTTAGEKVELSRSNLALAEQELVVLNSGTLQEQITAQKAQIKESQANVQYHLTQLEKYTLVSPINGVIIVQNLNSGTIVTPSTNVISIISEGNYKIEAQVVEADIANLDVGDCALLTLDAYGDEVVFEAEVAMIDPAAELLEGVANYKTTLRFKNSYEKVRVGMTADIDIVTQRNENVITIPQRAVIFKDGSKFVRILRGDNSVEQREVQTGITGVGGVIEISTGISEGDQVIVSIKD